MTGYIVSGGLALPSAFNDADFFDPEITRGQCRNDMFKFERNVPCDACCFQKFKDDTKHLGNINDLIESFSP